MRREESLCRFARGASAPERNPRDSRDATVALPNPKLGRPSA